MQIGESPAEILDPRASERDEGLAGAAPTFGRAVLQLYKRYESLYPAELKALLE
ncbi:MAG: hypothetical protein OXC11_12575 [Rhodospirillales bacterium]|nr:hypothetical protein [Rhodospirillales bacterium]